MSYEFRQFMQEDADPNDEPARTEDYEQMWWDCDNFGNPQHCQVCGCAVDAEDEGICIDCFYAAINAKPVR